MAAAYREYLRALQSGLIVRARHCSKCGKESGEMHGHHRDYSQPLVVEWLCAPCHGRAGAGSGAGKKKITLYLDRALVERARGAVAWAQMRGEEPESISAMMNAALAAELERLKDVLKPDGGEFPRLGSARKGRPPSRRGVK